MSEIIKIFLIFTICFGLFCCWMFLSKEQKIYIRFKILKFVYTYSGFVKIHTDGDNIKINYYDDALTLYRIVYPRKRGPRTISNIYTLDGSISEDLLVSYLGPYGNFHGIPTTPKMLNTDVIIVEYMNGLKKTYENNTIIDLIYDEPVTEKL